MGVLGRMKIYHLITLATEMKRLKLHLGRNNLDSTLTIKLPTELQDIEPYQFGAIQNYKNHVELRFYFKALKEKLSESELFNLLDAIDKELESFRVKDRKGYLAFQFKKYDKESVRFIQSLSIQLEKGLQALSPEVYEKLELCEEELEELCGLDICEEYVGMTAQEIIRKFQQEDEEFKNLYKPLQQEEKVAEIQEETELSVVQIQKNIPTEVLRREHKAVKITRYFMNAFIFSVYVGTRLLSLYKKSR